MIFFKRNINLTKALIPFIFAVSFLLVPIVYAQSLSTTNPSPALTTSNPSNSTCPANQLCNPLKVSSVQDVLYLIVNIATYVGVILGVLALIWVGFKFIAAQGNSEKLKEARKFFYAVIIGIAILIGASAIVTIIKNTLTTAGVVQSGVFGS
jgi:hypothetical protein